MRSFTTIPQPYGLEQAHEWLTRQQREWDTPHGNRTWTVEVVGAAPLSYAGAVDLRPTADRWDIGFALHPAARGRGVMSAAVRAATRWAFVEGAASVYWAALVGNHASAQVARACGFTYQATLPRYAPGPHGVEDAWVGYLLPGEPSPNNSWDGLR